jgi:hypothetical protein
MPQEQPKDPPPQTRRQLEIAVVIDATSGRIDRSNHHVLAHPDPEWQAAINAQSVVQRVDFGEVKKPSGEVRI